MGRLSLLCLESKAFSYVIVYNEKRLDCGLHTVLIPIYIGLSRTKVCLDYILTKQTSSDRCEERINRQKPFEPRREKLN